MNSRDQKDFRPKKEGDLNYNKKFPKITSSSRQWSCHKNPRIVRVSRAFGGKDRHSKVCTVRGLRDRRIRLSVPTAIQLYDLQDRLGLNQPSKVIDWLLDATKHDIDKLPPLPMLPGSFTQFHQPTQVAPSHQPPAANNPQSSLSHFLASTHHNAKNSGFNPTKEGITIASQQEQENQEGFGGYVAQLSAQNLFPLNNNIQSSSFANFPYNSYFHWDHPLSHVGGGYPFPNQAEDHHSQNNLSTAFPSNSQLYFCPSATSIPPIIPSFPSYVTPPMDNDWKQMNGLQNVQQNPLLSTTLHLISSPMKSFNLNVNSKSVHLQQNDNVRREKDNRS